MLRNLCSCILDAEPNSFKLAQSISSVERLIPAATHRPHATCVRLIDGPAGAHVIPRPLLALSSQHCSKHSRTLSGNRCTPTVSEGVAEGSSAQFTNPFKDHRLGAYGMTQAETCVRILAARGREGGFVRYCGTNAIREGRPDLWCCANAVRISAQRAPKDLACALVYV